MDMWTPASWGQQVTDTIPAQSHTPIRRCTVSTWKEHSYQ